MNIAYTVMSVDDSRAELKGAIRERMSNFHEITDIEFVDARIPGNVEKYLLENSLMVTNSGFHYGELGVWFSQINAWKYIAESEYDGVIVFEDDAVVDGDFEQYLKLFSEHLPADYDFMTLSVPSEQHLDYYYNRAFNENGGWTIVGSNYRTVTSSDHFIGNMYVATAYQGYACVATMYSPKGARRLLETLDRRGFYTPVDCFLFTENFRGSVQGYAPLPTVPKVVTYHEKGTIARSTGMYAP